MQPHNTQPNVLWEAHRVLCHFVYRVTVHKPRHVITVQVKVRSGKTQPKATVDSGLNRNPFMTAYEDATMRAPQVVRVVANALCLSDALSSRMPSYQSMIGLAPNQGP